MGKHSARSPTFSGIPYHSLKIAKLILSSKNLREVTKQNTKRSQPHHFSTILIHIFTTYELQ
jgi:hypothetical protein